MATQDTGTSAEKTIAQEASALRAEILKLQEELEAFLHQPSCEKATPAPPYADPLAEIVAILEDCRKLVLDIRHLSIDRIARRISV